MGTKAKELIAKYHDPKHLDVADGEHVIQLWEDGEITTQKGGGLMWQRILHALSWPLVSAKEHCIQMPVAYNIHSYALVSHEQALEIRAAWFL